MEAKVPAASSPTFKVLLIEQKLVAPLKPTASHDYFLSNIDQVSCFIMQTVDFFEASPARTVEAGLPDPARTLQEALKKVLVHYYPLAGRLGRSSEGKLYVQCNDEGVLYVEAEADTCLSALPQLPTPDQPWLGKLVYEQAPAGASNILALPLVAVQVTRFQCGGFVLGLSVNHCMLDGVSVTEFLSSWSELARGEPLSTPPYIDRSLLKARTPPQVSYPHNETLQLKDLEFLHVQDEDDVFKFFCFSNESLKRLKNTAMEDGELLRCTTFEALSGLVWRSRTKAMGLVREQKTRLFVPVNCRNRIKPPLPKGYMGNATYPAHVLTTVGELTEMPLSHTIKKVQAAFNSMDNNYLRSAIDYMEVSSATPSLTATLMITNWSRLTFHMTDFGWGKPKFSGPVLVPDKEFVAILCDSRDKESVILLVGLSSHAMQTFEQLIEPHL